MTLESLRGLFSDIYFPLWVAGLCIAFVLALLLWMNLSRRSALSPRTHWFAHVIEAAILAALCLFLTMIGGFQFPTEAFPDHNRDLVFERMLMAASLGGWPAIWGLLLAARVASSRIAFLILALLTLAGWHGYLYVTLSLPFSTDLESFHNLSFLGDRFKDTIFITTLFTTFRSALWILGSFLVALYFVRFGFSWAKFLLGSLFGGYTLLVLLSPFFIPEPGLYYPLHAAVMFCVIVALPLQRLALERLLGFPLRSRAADSVTAHLTPVTPLQSSAGHVAIAFLVLAGFASLVVNYFERDFLHRTVRHNPQPSYASPALINALPHFNAYFSKSRSPRFPEYAYLPHAAELSSPQTSESITRILTDWDIVEFKRYVETLRPFLTAFEDAGKADYVEAPEGQVLDVSFPHLRGTARMLAARAALAMSEGRPLNAVWDMKSLFRMGGLLRHQPDLVQQMIGSAMRNIGTAVAYNILTCGRKNEQTLLALNDALSELAPQGQWELDFEAMRRGESWVSDPIVPFAESSRLMMPTLDRALGNCRMGWVNFDLVRLAAAIELFRYQTGELPETLQDLHPAYIKRLPRDPFEGNAYKYWLCPCPHQTCPPRYNLALASWPDSKKYGSLQAPLPFPFADETSATVAAGKTSAENNETSTTPERTFTQSEQTSAALNSEK